MPTSVIGLFEDQDTARKVVDMLTKAGVNEDAVETWSDTSADKVAERLIQAGYDEDKARRYGEVLETAGAQAGPIPRRTVGSDGWLWGFGSRHRQGDCGRC